MTAWSENEEESKHNDKNVSMSQVASPCVIMKSLMIDVCHMTAWQEQQCQAQHESGRFSCVMMKTLMTDVCHMTA